jgi:peptidoglycan/LPS O-acetylase OafA/YrhL
MGFYLNNRFNLGWENFHYTFGLGRGCVGFFIGILLRKSESEKEIKFSKRRFIFAIVGFLATFSIYPFVQAVIFIAAIPSYFVISEASRVNVNGLNRKFHSSCVFLGKISFGLYIWHAPLIGSHRPVQSILGIEPNSVAGSISSVIVQIGLTVFLTILSVTYFDKFFRSLLQKLFETR